MAWKNFALTVDSSKTITHTAETIDGVVFLVTSIYDEEGMLEYKQLIRGDLVHG